MLLAPTVELRAATDSQPRLLVLGDSLSAAYGISEQDGWVQLLRERLASHRLHFNVINASISGETTAGGLRRLPAAIERWQPSVTIVELGGNDGLRGTPVTSIEDNLQQMIDQLHAAGSDILLLGMRIPPNYGPRYSNAFHQMYHDLARDNAIPLVSFFLDGVATVPGKMQADGIHPTAAAQPAMLDNVWPLLSQILEDQPAMHAQ